VTFSNPLSEIPGQDDVEDLERVRQARAGSREALEALIKRHQGWIYNSVRRMTYNPADGGRHAGDSDQAGPAEWGRVL